MERKLVPAYKLKDIPFPDCTSKCAIRRYLGVGECDSICGFKFVVKEKKGEEDESSETGC